MSVTGLALDASSRSPIVLLRDPSGRRQVPIWIDHSQAHNILAGIQNPDPKRPLSHDLMISLLKAGNLQLEKVIIHSIEESTFQAVLKIRSLVTEKESEHKNSSSIIELDTRPSDAIALAVRSKCSIWMLESVVAEASFPVDLTSDEKDQDEFRRFVDQVSPSDLVRHLKERLSENEGPVDNQGQDCGT